MLTPDEATANGFVLTIPECAERLEVRVPTLRGMLGLPPDHPHHLPSAPVKIRGPVARRVRPQDLDRLLERLGDPIRAAVAIELLAGKPVKSGTRHYHRHFGRLRAAVDSGRVRELVIPGQAERRYARADVQRLRAEFVDDGVPFEAARDRRRASIKAARAARAGLISSSEVAAATGVSSSTVAAWGRAGLYGAQRVAGTWCFDPDLLVHRKPRAPREADVEVACVVCGAHIRRGASKVRRATEKAKAAGADPQFFCGPCWTTEGYEHRRHAGGAQRGAHYERMSESLREQWATGRRDRDRRAAEMRERTVALCRSPKRFVEREVRRNIVLHGRELTEDEKQAASGRALSRAQRSSDRSRETRNREDRVRQMWGDGLTIPAIASEIGESVEYVKKLRQRMALPPRKPGRRPNPGIGDKTRLGAP